MPSRRTQSAFSLVELLLALALLGMLAGFALWSYRDVTIRAQRDSARSALLEVLAREQRHLALDGRYTASAQDLGYTPDALGRVAFPAGDNRARYVLHLQVPDPQQSSHGADASFVATLEPVGPQRTDACGRFSIDNLGVHGAGAEGCW